MEGAYRGGCVERTACLKDARRKLCVRDCVCGGRCTCDDLPVGNASTYEVVVTVRR